MKSLPPNSTKAQRVQYLNYILELIREDIHNMDECFAELTKMSNIDFEPADPEFGEIFSQALYIQSCQHPLNENPHALSQLELLENLVDTYSDYSAAEMFLLISNILKEGVAKNLARNEIAKNILKATVPEDRFDKLRQRNENLWEILYSANILANLPDDQNAEADEEWKNILKFLKKLKS